MKIPTLGELESSVGAGDVYVCADCCTDEERDETEEEDVTDAVDELDPVRRKYGYGAERDDDEEDDETLFTGPMEDLDEVEEDDDEFA
jgi:hypothetical protein